MKREQRNSTQAAAGKDAFEAGTDHGPCQPTLWEFVQQKTIERAIGAKGYGAFGTFQAFRPMGEYTTAGFLQQEGQSVPVFSRFSLAAGPKGTPDTMRNIRGFATKFYTAEGNFDLLCSHIPVCPVRGAAKLTGAIRALSRDPDTNLPDLVSFWRFVASNPEAVHSAAWLYSDLGTLDSFRCMRAFGVVPYVWINGSGVRRYVKYHWTPLAGTRQITQAQAVKLAGAAPDVAGQDLFDTIAGGHRVQYDLCVQLMTMEEAARQPYDVLDATRIWAQREFPFLTVGRLTLDRNPDSYIEEVEKSAFSPANLLPGMELSESDMLCECSAACREAQRHRLGPEFCDIPVNRARGGTADGGPSADRQTRAGQVCGAAENFIQAGERFRSLSSTGQNHLADNIASELYAAPSQIQSRVLGYFRAADARFETAVRRRINGYLA